MEFSSRQHFFKNIKKGQENKIFQPLFKGILEVI